MFAHFWIDFVTLFSVVNPVAMIPAYLALTERLEPTARESVLRRAIVIATGILLAFLVVGEIVLEALGVTLDAFRIGGGLVLLRVGLAMIFGEMGAPEPTDPVDATSRDIAAFPLAMPLLAGAGAMMATVLLTENDLHNIPQQTGTAITLCVVLALSYLILKLAEPIHRLLGNTGTIVVGRVMGLLITAISVQVMITGLQNVFLPGR